MVARDVERKPSLRASVIVLEDVLLPSDAQLPHAKGASGPLEFLNEARFAIVFGAIGAARDCPEAGLDYVTTRVQFDLPIAGFQLA
jgi:glutaryl-CoA dehydrogenase